MRADALPEFCPRSPDGEHDVVIGELAAHCRFCDLIPLNEMRRDQEAGRGSPLLEQFAAHPRARLSRGQRLMLVIELAERDGMSCFYCEQQLIALPSDHERAATIDHVLARSHGGLYHPQNVVLACRDCNKEKAADFVMLVEAIRRARRQRDDSWRSLELLGWVWIESVPPLDGDASAEGADDHEDAAAPATS